MLGYFSMICVGQVSSIADLISLILRTNDDSLRVSNSEKNEIKCHRYPELNGTSRLVAVVGAAIPIYPLIYVVSLPLAQHVNIYGHSIFGWVAVTWIEWWGDDVAATVRANGLSAQIILNDMWLCIYLDINIIWKIEFKCTLKMKSAFNLVFKAFIGTSIEDIH